MLTTIIVNGRTTIVHAAIHPQTIGQCEDSFKGVFNRLVEGQSVLLTGDYRPM